MGSVEQVVPMKIHKFHTKQIVIKHLPPQCNQDQLSSLVSQYGQVEKVDFVSSEKDCLANITYGSEDQAKQAYEVLNGHEFDGAVLKVDLVTDRPRGRSRSDSRLGGKQRPFNANSVPLRILVPSQYIGAIIGKKGECIRSITTKCKARVDVHGKENNGLLEKVISIYGQPENCSNACREILQVIQSEAKTESEAKKELLLKMLTNNHYCGRLIGKEGRVIKKIREETGTKIIVNSAHDMALFPDRVISIRGNIDNMVEAERAIATKLAQCMEQDFKYIPAYGMSTMYMNGYQHGPFPLSPPAGQKYYGTQNGSAHPTRSCPAAVGGTSTAAATAAACPPATVAPAAAGYYPHSSQQLQQQPVLEISQIQVPNSAVGAIIGAGGSHIKQMMRISGAFIMVESRKDVELTPSSERIVTIRGAPDACWRANYYIFEKMKQEGFSGNDDVRLMTMITIPRAAVGRVIGKSGRNVREIQRVTGSIIKLPLDSSSGGSGANNISSSSNGAKQSDSDVEQQQQLSPEVVVEVHGTFLATQNAQRRIRALVELALNGVSSAYSSFAPVYQQPRYSRSAPRISTA